MIKTTIIVDDITSVDDNINVIETNEHFTNGCSYG